MAVFEPERARIVLRIVYDGPGRAGKTTNVEQLARIFGTRPGDELQVHPAATGRTIFFDWFSFDGGVLDGRRLQVQVVTVPGHKSLEPRRAHILHGADVVVLVCDSAVSGQDSAREMLDSLREHLGKSAVHVPLLVQANKQDLPNAMLPHELGAALGLGPDVPVIGAQASAGIGVRETAVGAIQAAVRQMKQRTARDGLGALTGRAGTAEQLRAALQTIESLGVHRDPGRSSDEGRVVYIRSAKLVTQLAGDGDGPGRPRTLAPVSQNMSEKPAAERPARPKIPVSAMFIEPTPLIEPPDIPSPPPPTVRVPPPPVLAHADAPLAIAEPFDPEEARSDLATPDDAPAPVAPASHGSLRERWPTEPLAVGELATESQDADETGATAPDPEPGPSLAETAEAVVPAPRPDDERGPPDAGLAPQLAAAEPVPEDSHHQAAPDDADAALLAPPHGPEDGHSPGPPVQQDTSSAAAPVPDEHVSGDSRNLAAPVAAGAVDGPLRAHVSEDSPAADPPPGSASATARPAHVPEDILTAASSPDPASAAAAPSHVPEDSLSADRPASSPQDPAGFAAAPSPPAHVPEDSQPATTPPPDPASAAPPPVPEDISAAPQAANAPAPPSAPVPEAIQDSPPADLAVPRPDLPPGHVWPVPGGRHVLERLAGAALVRARPGGHAPSDMLYQAGGFCLRTRPGWRFDDDERGRAALREHVRRAARLGPLLPADTAVALALGDPDHVLWHIVPALPALAAELRDAAEREHPRRHVRLASAYAAALRLRAREGLALDLDPHAFAEQDGRWVYLGDRLGEPAPADPLVSALLRPPAGSLAAWLDALEQVLPAVLTRDDVAALGLADAPGGSDTAPEAHARLRAILGRCA